MMLWKAAEKPFKDPRKLGTKPMYTARLPSLNPDKIRHNFLFEVWDYTNSDLVLSYRSTLSDQCVQNGVTISMQNFIYKYNKKLEEGGCDLPLMKDGIDLLTNFEKAMLDLGFKK
jgi:hypothetical protein